MVVRTASLATNVGMRIVKPGCGAAGVFLLLTASSVSGQQPGDTVRVSGEQVGVVVEADSAGLLLSFGYARSTNRIGVFSPLRAFQLARSPGVARGDRVRRRGLHRAERRCR